VAESAERALELFATAAPAVVLSDVRMAGMGGLKLLEALKRLNPALPVVIMTAFGSIPDAVEAMRLGAYDYLTKPFTADQILHVVARALEVHELRSENKELRDRIESLTEPEPFLTYSPHSRKLSETAAQVADSDATVLVTGESGTGRAAPARACWRRTFTG
jgi:DNA-binding NtrC family response regulator